MRHAGGYPSIKPFSPTLLFLLTQPIEFSPPAKSQTTVVEIYDAKQPLIVVEPLVNLFNYLLFNLKDIALNIKKWYQKSNNATVGTEE